MPNNHTDGNIFKGCFYGVLIGTIIWGVGMLVLIRIVN